MGLPSAKNKHSHIFITGTLTSWSGSRSEAAKAIVSVEMDGLLTLAGADEEVAVGSDPTKSQVHHRPSVAGACQRSLSHCHSLPVGLEMGHTMPGNCGANSATKTDG